ncbi:peroxiredoxin ahpE [Mycobacterium tuberculosis T17]|nr:peroxiredoxin ahpE [Mycobacterium tuberculosis T17]
MLNVGATAPDFTLRDQNQQLVTLRGYRGAKNVLLVFFSVGVHGHSARASWTSCVITCPSLRTTTAPR